MDGFGDGGGEGVSGGGDFGEYPLTDKGEDCTAENYGDENKIFVVLFEQLINGEAGDAGEEGIDSAAGKGEE